MTCSWFLIHTRMHLFLDNNTKRSDCLLSNYRQGQTLPSLSPTVAEYLASHPTEHTHTVLSKSVSINWVEVYLREKPYFFLFHYLFYRHSGSKLRVAPLRFALGQNFLLDTLNTPHSTLRMKLGVSFFIDTRNQLKLC